MSAPAINEQRALVKRPVPQGSEPQQHFDNALRADARACVPASARESVRVANNSGNGLSVDDHQAAMSEQLASTTFETLAQHNNLGAQAGSSGSTTEPERKAENTPPLEVAGINYVPLKDPKKKREADKGVKQQEAQADQGVTKAAEEADITMKQRQAPELSRMQAKQELAESKINVPASVSANSSSRNPTNKENTPPLADKTPVTPEFLKIQEERAKASPGIGG